jgi:flagellar hook-associated protein 2
MSNILTSSSSSSSSSSNGTSAVNTLRITGMASGIDTDAVVKSMVSSYQEKIDQQDQAEQTLQWKQEAYQSIIKDVKGLQEYFDPLSSKYIMSSSSLNINSASSDNSSVVSATADSTAKAGTYKISVSQLATQANITGSSKDSLVAVTNLQNWSGQTLSFGTSGSINLSSISGTTPNDTSMSALVSDINNQIANNPSLNGQISASYVNSGGTSYIKFTNLSSNSITLNQAATGSTTVSDVTSNVAINSGISASSKLVSDLGFSSSAGPINFTLNGTSVSLNVDSTTTVQDLMNAVNSATSGAITMNVDDTTGKISFQSKGSGSSNSISIVDSSTSNNVLTTFGIATTSTNTAVASGTDAIVSITEPGQTTATTTTQSSNNFTVNGVAYNLVGANSSADITVTANSDNVINNIKSFITDYNSVVSEIYTKLNEKPDSNYPPLTDAQKASMSTDQINQWNTKAQVGILRNDDLLSGLMTQLNGIFSTPVYSSYTSGSPNTGKVALSFGQYGSNAIGIDTSSDVTSGGQLVIDDETKLQNAIENNFSDFQKLFMGTSDTTTSSTNQSYVGSTQYMQDGILTRINNVLKDYVSNPGIGEDGTYSFAGSMNIFVNKQYDFSATGTSGENTLPDQIYARTLNISKLQTQMNDAENRYYAQFSALESAMNSLNSQQSVISSMLGTTG